jgi:two-component system, LytTR family, sensor kinase
VRWALWGVIFGPLIYRAAYRLGARRTGVFWIVVAALPVMLIYTSAVDLLLSSRNARLELFQPMIVFTLTAGYGLLAQNEDRRVAAERARADAEQRFSAARVETLRSELQPHFLFNALNTVSALASRDPETAASIAEKLRDLFRASAGAALPQVTSVEEEVAFTRKYLDIQQARFEERLRTSFALQPGVENARVPSLLLQPLVENAIRHGMTRSEGVTLEVQIERATNELRIHVINDGAADDRPVIEGVGLSNTRARLRALYGGAASFTARRRSEGGFAVDVCIPYDGNDAHSDR